MVDPSSVVDRPRWSSRLGGRPSGGRPSCRSSRPRWSSRRVVEPVETTRAFWQDLGSRGSSTCMFTSCPTTSSGGSTSSSTTPGRRSAASGRSATAAATTSASSCCVRSRSTTLLSAAVRASPGHRDVPQRLGGGLRRRRPRVAVVGDVLPGAGGGGVRQAAARGRCRGVQDPRAGGEFHLDDPALDKVWGILEDAGTPIVVHAGSGRSATPSPVRPAAPGARALPRLAVAVAHGCSGVRGVPRAGGALREGVPRHHDGLHGLLRRGGAVPPCAARTAAGPAAQVLLGGDFPTIPYPYAHQLTGLDRLGLGEQWLRDVCWNSGSGSSGNPFGLSARATYSGA